jgi:hypothetical protein
VYFYYSYYGVYSAASSPDASPPVASPLSAVPPVTSLPMFDISPALLSLSLVSESPSFLASPPSA